MFSKENKHMLFKMFHNSESWLTCLMKEMQRDCFYTKAGKILEGSEHNENVLTRSLPSVATLPYECSCLWSLPPP